MYKFSTPHLTRAAVALAAVSAFALAPMAAQAAGDTAPTGTNTSGVLSAGNLTFTVPALGSFDKQLTGVTQTVKTTVGAWNITDARGSHAGYSVNVTASVPTSGANTLPANSITITPTVAGATEGNTGTIAPVTGTATTQAATPLGVQLSGSAATIDDARGNTGEGSWDFADDGTTAKSLAVVIPSDTTAGTYSSTLTFTAAALVA